MNAIIAVNPQQMAEAQATTITWAEKKLLQVRHELSIAASNVDALRRAGLKSVPAEKMVGKANRRIQFYEKVKAALLAGYYIIPPFDIQLFAIRTDRASPDDETTRRWAKEYGPRSMPAGKGEYVNPEPPRVLSGRVKTEATHDGKTREVALYHNANWGNVEIPVRAIKPQLIEAVGRALEEKIFDALGIAPAYRAADPIIAGQIKRPDGKGVLTFFVAWWLDESDL